MSRPILTAAQMRAAEERAIAAGTSVETLMERAGAAVADAAFRFGAGRPALVLCGPGNNGGDGYVAARLLAARGVEVRVAATCEPRTEAARAAKARWTGAVEAIGEARMAPVLIDALFGVGLTRPLDAPTIAALLRLAAGSQLAIAVDVPSGTASDDGRLLNDIPAFDITLALGGFKPGHLLQPAAAKAGRLLLADIRVDVASPVSVLAQPRLAPPGPDDHKYSRGMVAVVASDMPGAATLGASAAARLAGYTILCGKGDAPASVVRRGFNQTLGDGRLNAVLIGPGLSDTPQNRVKLDAALASAVPVVLDAGALALIPPELNRAAPTVLTPHEGEFTRLFGDRNTSKLERARDAAERSGATIVFKGADTVIASPGGRITLSPAASPWLASAGTGDVLAGIVAAMLARGSNPHDDACAAVWLHGESARRAGAAFLADDLIDHLPAAVASCL